MKFKMAIYKGNHKSRQYTICAFFFFFSEDTFSVHFVASNQTTSSQVQLQRTDGKTFAH